MDKFSVCLIVPPVGGGTFRHVKELAIAWSNECTTLLLVHRERVIKLYIFKDGKIIDEKIFCKDKFFFMSELIEAFNIKLLHVHHFLYMDNDMYAMLRDLSIPYIVTLHDYYTICPRINLVNESGKYCRERGVYDCDDCISDIDLQKYDLFARQDVNINTWRFLYYNVLKKAEMVLCPSRDLLNRMKKYYPDLCYIYSPNPEIIPMNIPLNNYKNQTDYINIGLIGALDDIKGREIILKTAKYIDEHNIKIKLILFGTFVPYLKKDREYGCLEVKGRYDENNIYSIINKEKIDFFWFPAIWPETYSYTLSIPARLHYACISADIGAIAERIKENKWGETYPLEISVEDMVNKLIEFDYAFFGKIGRFDINNTSFEEILRNSKKIIDTYSYSLKNSDIKEFVSYKSIKNIKNMSFYEFRHVYAVSDSFYEKICAIKNISLCKWVDMLREMYKKKGKNLIAARLQAYWNGVS